MRQPDPENPDDLSLDRLAGDWRIYQFKRGHRFSADDLFTAWVASRASPEARVYADIGAGIGSVGLLTLWRLSPTTTLTAVEVQEASHRLMRKTVEHNGLTPRVQCRLGDLRDPDSIPERDHFELVTGSPPYIPLGKGVVSPIAQRAGARMELRGSIYDYAEAAARIMRPGGTFVVCFASADPRGEDAIARAGLHLRARQDVIFRGGQAPLVTVLVATREHGPCDRREPFAIRGPDGEWTEAYFAMRREMGTDVYLERAR